ncbi:MAG: hypothetical protein DMD61_11015 [Gemmatimonadetes bacterium]|nr:MAG: hypothetical protein DMD61_11015 [Gemmatimonadota bacterium]
MTRARIVGIIGAAVLVGLRRLTHALETDPAAQERAAREQFGMIRKGELLYRLVPKVDPGNDSGALPPRD